MNKQEPRVFIRQQICKEVNPIVESYFMIAHNTSKFPYATIDVKEIDDEALTRYSLEIEIFSKKEDTTELEKICDNLKEKLNRKRVVADGYAYVIWFDTCLTDKEEDKTIKKRVLSFEIHLFSFN